MQELPELAGLGVFDGRLREVARDPEIVEAALEAAHVALTRSTDPLRQLQLYGYAGNALRLLGRHAEAIAAQERSLALALAAEDEPRALAARIRLGEARRCADDLSAAETDLRTALAAARERPELELTDFALQHLGKCLTDAGRRGEGMAALAEALALREAKGDERLVHSTRLALERARRG